GARGAQLAALSVRARPPPRKAEAACPDGGLSPRLKAGEAAFRRARGPGQAGRDSRRRSSGGRTRRRGHAVSRGGMSGDLVRASDDDRERAIRSLREHLAAGRLTLEEFTERISAALAATTTADLAAPLHELPPAQRAGRLRLRHRALCISLFGNVDLDLRQATLEGDVITIFAVAAFAALDVYVPEGVEVDLHGLTAFGHKDAQGSDVEPLPGTPL